MHVGRLPYKCSLAKPLHTLCVLHRSRLLFACATICGLCLRWNSLACASCTCSFLSRNLRTLWVSDRPATVQQCILTSPKLCHRTRRVPQQVSQDRREAAKAQNHRDTQDTTLSGAAVAQAVPVQKAHPKIPLLGITMPMPREFRLNLGRLCLTNGFDFEIHQALDAPKR